VGRVEKLAEIEEHKGSPKSEYSAKRTPSAGRFFMKFRGPQALPNRVEKPAEVEESKSPPKSEHSAKGAANAGRFFMKFRGPQALPNRPRKTMVGPTLKSLKND
jgi:ribosomal protein S10